MAVSNFANMIDYFPGLAALGVLAEKNIYCDSNTTLMKTGMLCEKSMLLMGKMEHLYFSKLDPFVMINELEREGIIEGNIVSDLHFLRKKRNMAAHQIYESVEDAKLAVEIAYDYLGWFVEVYGKDGDKYEHKPFVLPKEGDTIYEDASEEEQAKLNAHDSAVAEQLPAEELKKRKQKAAEKRKLYNRNMTEAETRVLIDAQLQMVGWEADTVNLRYSKGTRPAKGRNIAIAEWPTDSTVGDKGFVDYALFIGEKLAGVIEAKAVYKDIPSVIDYQGKDYARNIRHEDDQYVIKEYGEYRVPFIFATNGRPYIEQFKTKSGIWMRDNTIENSVPRALAGWMSPMGIEEAIVKNIEAGNKALKNLSYDLLRDKDGLNLREYQIKAVEAAEKAVMGGAKTALLAMATGTGKTRTVLGMIYRFLKTERFKRILFLVDRTALGKQAQDVFAEVKLEELMTLDNIYGIKKIEDPDIEKSTRVHVATVQGMVKRILYNGDAAKPAVSDYDLIVVDEAHRGYTLDKDMSEGEELYRDQEDFQSKYRKVIEYFDAVKIALTATPALHTSQIFGPPVFRYTYREAVIDGYLVDHDAPHRIETKLSKEGIIYKKGDKVQIYRAGADDVENLDWTEDEIKFDVDKFNKQIIVPEFNKVVLHEIADNIDPEDVENHGKTLIYAVDDAHADMIVDILKNYYVEMGVPEEAIMKITGSVGGGNPKKVEEAIKRFRNERFPSIAVTVDLLTTGIDVPEITTLVFMRRVKSRILFEQMLGRATRLCPEIHKTHFEIYDPVGTYDSLEQWNTMKPIAVNNTATFSELVHGVEIQTEAQAEETAMQIISKLHRKKRAIKGDAMEQFKDLTGGRDINAVISIIKDALNGNAVIKAAESSSKDDVYQMKVYDMSTGSQVTSVKEIVGALKKALLFLDDVKSSGEGRVVIIDDRKDTVIETARGFGKNNCAPDDYLKEFTEFIQTHKNEIDALNIVCTRPSDLTRSALKSLKLTLDREGFTEQQLNTAINSQNNTEIAADIISIIRRYAVGSTLMSHEECIKGAVQRLKANNKFSAVELRWINNIEAYLLNESVMNVGVFEEDKRFKGRIQKQFKHDLGQVVKELNTYLYEDLRGAV